VVADRRAADPHDGALLGPTLDAARAALAGDDEIAVAVVLQRLGTGRLLACTTCRELAQCPTCQSPEHDDGDDLVCPTDGARRPRFCTHCGATRLRAVRSGVTTLARDVAAQLATEVTEVTATTSREVPLARVVVGTEAVLHRVRRAALVVFADFDQYLLAPRARARLDGVYAVALAGRIVGGRGVGRGAVVIQTRRDDTVVRSLVTGTFDELATEEDEIARVLQNPPYGGVAHLSGAVAEAYAAALADAGLSVDHGDVEFTVHAASDDELCDVLSATPRPTGRLRVAVD
jgi:primosomal protein N' (replication factor Y)